MRLLRRAMKSAVFVVLPQLPPRNSSIFLTSLSSFFIISDELVFLTNLLTCWIFWIREVVTAHEKSRFIFVRICIRENSIALSHAIPLRLATLSWVLSRSCSVGILSLDMRDCIARSWSAWSSFTYGSVNDGPSPGIFSRFHSKDVSVLHDRESFS